MGSSQSKSNKSYGSSSKGRRSGYDENSSVLTVAMASEHDRPLSLARSSSSSFLNHPIYLPPQPHVQSHLPRDMHLAPPPAKKRLARKVKKGRSNGGNATSQVAQMQQQLQLQQQQQKQQQQQQLKAFTKLKPSAKAQSQLQHSQSQLQLHTSQHWPLIASDHHHYHHYLHNQNLLYANGGGGATYVNEGAAAIGTGVGRSGHAAAKAKAKASATAASQAFAAVATSNKKKQRRLLQQQQQQQQQQLHYNHLPPMDSPPSPPTPQLFQQHYLADTPLALNLLQSTQELEFELQSSYSSSSLTQSPPLQQVNNNEIRAFAAAASQQAQQIPPPPDQFYSTPTPQTNATNLTNLVGKSRETKAGKKQQQAGKLMSSNHSEKEQEQEQDKGAGPKGIQMERGLALSYDQRKRQALLGLLPAAIQDQELQIRGVINFVEHCCKDELGKYVYLRNLKDFNENLFYAALSKHVEKLMPIVYTPTVGLACQKFSEIYLRPRGLFISANEAGQVSQVLANWPQRDVLVIVVTDGERILGLGDLGANGMGISIGKLSLYTALAGIPPQNVLPITIDVGTNNETYLKDPLYIGLRQERLRGAKYDELIDEFMRAAAERFGRTCLIQFEDFANSNAFGLLQRYRQHYCTFNDDIQGTASVCLSGLISAARVIGRRMADCSFLFYGAGEANLGTAQLLVMAMTEEGASREEAQSRIWLVDSKGLVVNSRTDLSGHKRRFAQEAPHLRDLEEIIEYTKPQGIVGASAQGGAFTESICKKMASFNERPIIFALSNPTSKAECTADQAYRWTEGKCVFASGSPFEPVQYNGRTYVTGQGNNAYIFPAVGLASIAARIYTIPEETFLVAARALSDQLTPADSTQGLVYPSLSKIRDVTLRVATRVLEHFYSERLATYRPEPNDKLAFLKGIQYDYRYR